MASVTKICPVCKTRFKVKPSHIDRRCFCSRQCRKTGLRRRRQLEIEQKFDEPICELLERLYYHEKLGIKQIANFIGISDRVAWEWFEDLGIDKRTRTDAVAIQWKENDDRRALASKTMAENHSKNRIDNFGDNNPAKKPEVRKKISEAKKGKRNPMYNKFGPLNGNWRGGKITYRGKGWRGIRVQAIRRDGGKCVVCGSRKNLQVHHIVPYRETQDNSLSNLVTLCVSCHMAVEHGRATLLR